MDQDFGGFRVVALLPRFKPGWVPPRAYEDEAPKRHALLGAPKAPLPALMPNGKPICSAVIRAGPGFLEVPFFATQDTRRRKGYGRGLLQVTARFLGRRCKSLNLQQPRENLRQHAQIDESNCSSALHWLIRCSDWPLTFLLSLPLFLSITF